MDPNILLAIIGGAALAVGLGLGKILFARNTQKKMEEAEIKAETILKEAELRAETVKKEKEVEAKERFVQLKAAHEREMLDKNKKLNETENRIRQKEQSISQKEGNLDKQVKDNDAIKENLNRQIEVVNQRRAELDKKQEEHVRRLEKIANLSAEEARNQLVESLKQEAETRALVIQQEIIEEAKQKAGKEARPGWAGRMARNRGALGARARRMAGHTQQDSVASQESVEQLRERAARFRSGRHARDLFSPGIRVHRAGLPRRSRHERRASSASECRASASPCQHRLFQQRISFRNELALPLFKPLIPFRLPRAEDRRCDAPCFCNTRLGLLAQCASA